MVPRSLTILTVPTALYNCICSVHCAQLETAPMRGTNLASHKWHVIPQANAQQSNNLNQTWVVNARQ